MAGAGSSYTVFHWLNLLRGLAAFAVVLYHARPILGIQLAPSGYLAVDLFFILSGFVIAHVYDPRFAAGLKIGPFIMARAVRFWPLFALGTGLGAGWLILENLLAPPAAFSTGETVGIAALGLLYIPRLTGGDLFPMNVPAWSLFFELVVNAMFAAFFVATRARWLLAVVIVTGAGLASLAIAGSFDVQAWGGLRAVFGFTLGVLLYRSRPSVPNLPGYLPLAVLCATFALPDHPATEIACIFLVYPLGILMLSKASHARHGPLFDATGILSFPLYALHYPILQAALGLRDHLPVPAAVTGTVAILACLVAAWLGEHLVDRPIRNASRPRASRTASV